ncbi:MAG: NAD(+) synthase [Clostridia bacterium]
MRDGFIKVAAASPKLEVANCGYNSDNIISAIDKAHKEGVSVIVFPELCITSYSCDDLFKQDVLLNAAYSSLLKICASTKGREMVAVVGLPVNSNGLLYNCAAVLCDGAILGIVPKSYIPTYSEFYEKRHFKEAPKDNTETDILGIKIPFGTNILFECRETKELVLAVEICEDLFATISPSSYHTLNGATVIANLSASDEVLGKAGYRRSLTESQSGKCICAYIYSNANPSESTTDVVFSGHSIIAENGVILAESKPFGPEYTVTDIDLQRLVNDRRNQTSVREINKDREYIHISFSLKEKKTELIRKISSHPFIPEDTEKLIERCNDIFDIQCTGLKKRMEHSKSRTAVIGISGGLDSTLTLLVTYRAFEMMGKQAKDIICISMPCFGTTKRTKDNAKKLSELLNTDSRVIDISKAVKGHLKDIGHSGLEYDAAYENAQARERTQVLMDVANMTGGIVIGTGDLSEIALGWCTYNGDHMSMYAVNTSVPKTLIQYIVRNVADYRGGELRKVLYDILDTPISPELIPADDGEIVQKTEDIVGPYELHDFFLYHFMRWGSGPMKIFRLTKYAFQGKYTDEQIKKWLTVFYKRFFVSQFKRSCSPNGPKVGSVALSPRGDWRMPSDASVAEWLSEIEKI